MRRGNISCDCEQEYHTSDKARVNCRKKRALIHLKIKTKTMSHQKNCHCELCEEKRINILISVQQRGIKMHFDSSSGS
jgi:hypothetical protein